MKKIPILRALILMILAVATQTFSQEPIPKTSSVAVSASIQRVSNGESVIRTSAATDDDALAIANQRLAKALDALEKAERLIKALEAEIAARKRLDQVNQEIIEAKNGLILEQSKLIEIYKKQSGRKVSLLFGLVKIRY